MSANDRPAQLLLFADSTDGLFLSRHADDPAPPVVCSPRAARKKLDMSKTGERGRAARTDGLRRPRSGRIPSDSATWLESSPYKADEQRKVTGHRVVFAMRAPCRIVSCSRPSEYVAQVLCRVHYGQLSRMIGPPNGRRQDGRGAPRKDVPGYAAVHLRTEARYGHACDYCCQLCPARAEQWALPPSLVALICPATGLRYSPDPEDYMPLCASCHTRLDRRNPPRPGAEVLPLEVPRPVIRRKRWVVSAT